MDNLKTPAHKLYAHEWCLPERHTIERRYS